MAQDFINISEDSRYFYTSSNTFESGSHKQLTFYSLKHLYFSNFDTGSGLVSTTGSYDNYLETSLFSGSRKLESTGRGILYSIPQKLYGTHIEPSSVQISSSYSGPSSVGTGFVLTDDGEGNLTDNGVHIGNVIYAHGHLIITSPSYYSHLSASEERSDRPKISFKSNVPIYTSTYNIKVSDFEFNHTLNPTAQTGNTVFEYSGSRYLQPSGKYANNVTGSEFQPYITTIGLYNDSNELLIVGKLAQPLPKPADTELTIQLRLDV